MKLSDRTTQLINAMFDARERGPARALLLSECGESVPGCEGWSARALERIWISVLKLSEGDPKKLRAAVDLAHEDYRDLLMAAGFGHDTEAHLRWSPRLK